MTGEAKRDVFDLNSTNSVTFFPHGGPHKATLFVFAERAGSVGVMISIEGQILHARGGRIVFNGGSPQRLSLSDSNDSDPNVAFLKVTESAVLDATQIKVEMTFYQAGSHVFTFDAVAPLSQHKEWATVLERKEEQHRANLAKVVDEIAPWATVACSPNSPSVQRNAKAYRLYTLAQKYPCEVKEALPEGCIEFLRSKGALGPTAAGVLGSLRCEAVIPDLL